MLLYVALGEIELDIGNLTRCVACDVIDGIDETFVGREIEFLVAGKNLFVKILVYLDGIFLHDLFCRCVIARGR